MRQNRGARPFPGARENSGCCALPLFDPLHEQHVLAAAFNGQISIRNLATGITGSQGKSARTTEMPLTCTLKIVQVRRWTEQLQCWWDRHPVHSMRCLLPAGTSCLCTTNGAKEEVPSYLQGAAPLDKHWREKNVWWPVHHLTPSIHSDNVLTRDCAFQIRMEVRYRGAVKFKLTVQATPLAGSGFARPEQFNPESGPSKPEQHAPEMADIAQEVENNTITRTIISPAGKSLCGTCLVAVLILSPAFLPWLVWLSILYWL